MKTVKILHLHKSLRTLNLPYYIALRFGHGEKSSRFTSIVKKIAVISISLGLAVMISSVAIVTGFQQEIREKAIGFGSHIQITHFDYNISFEPQPISKDQPFYPDLKETPGISHIQIFATKAGIIRAYDEIHGVVLKGIGDDFDWSFFEKMLVEGEPITLDTNNISNDIIISKTVANFLDLELGDNVIMYFIQDPPRLRRFDIAGIYETGLAELDELFVIGDIRHIQRLNNWEEDQVAGFEVLIDDYSDLEKLGDFVYEEIGYRLISQTIAQLYPQIFDWLELLDMNVYVIIFLMVIVAVINMITTLLISVLEKTSLIGILKAIGASNSFISRVFLYNAGFMISKGLLIGNLIALAFCTLQYYTGLITLPQESYYVSEVPINLDITHILLLNAGTFAVCMIMLILPSYIVTRISPVKAITFR